MDKKMLRRAVKAKVLAMSAADKELSSALMRAALWRCIDACDAGVVAMFSPLPDEPQIWPLVDELSKTKTVVLPRVEGDVMSFYHYEPGMLSKGSFGIMEPVLCEAIEPSEIDLMVVPGVAFTADGYRMGRGKGYYDKYMSSDGFRAMKLGVCYSCQLVDELPVEPHDVRMDKVIYK